MPSSCVEKLIKASQYYIKWITFIISSLSFLLLLLKFFCLFLVFFMFLCCFFCGFCKCQTLRPRRIRNLFYANFLDEFLSAYLENQLSKFWHFIWSWTTNRCHWWDMLTIPAIWEIWYLNLLWHKWMISEHCVELEMARSCGDPWSLVSWRDIENDIE